MCVGCGGPSESENRAHFQPGCVERRKKYPHTPKESKDYPPVEIDHHGLVWVCGVVFINLFKCTHLWKRSIWWDQEGKFIPRASYRAEIK